MIGYTFSINGRDFFVARTDAPKKWFAHSLKKKLKRKNIEVSSTSFLMKSLVPCFFERDMVWNDIEGKYFCITGVEVIL